MHGHADMHKYQKIRSHIVDSVAYTHGVHLRKVSMGSCKPRANTANISVHTALAIKIIIYEEPACTFNLAHQEIDSLCIQ